MTERGAASDGIRVHPNPCVFGWSGCQETYTGGHYCDKSAGHDGDHVCFCKARRKNQ